MQKLTRILILTISLFCQAGHSEDIYYPAMEDQSGYVASYGSYEAPYTSDIDPFERKCGMRKEGCSNCSGYAYYNCRNAACLTAGILIGTAVIVGMIVIVINQSHCAHSSH